MRFILPLFAIFMTSSSFQMPAYAKSEKKVDIKKTQETQSKNSVTSTNEESVVQESVVEETKSEENKNLEADEKPKKKDKKDKKHKKEKKDKKEKNDDKKPWWMSDGEKQKAVDECEVAIDFLKNQEGKLSGDVKKRFERHLAFAKAELDYMKGVTESAIRRSSKSCRVNTKYARDILEKNAPSNTAGSFPKK